MSGSIGLRLRRFHQFAVDPAQKGRGLGKRLLELCFERARETGAEELALDTAEPAAELRRMYENLGFSLCRNDAMGTRELPQRGHESVRRRLVLFDLSQGAALFGGDADRAGGLGVGDSEGAASAVHRSVELGEVVFQIVPLCVRL